MSFVEKEDYYLYMNSYRLKFFFFWFNLSSKQRKGIIMTHGDGALPDGMDGALVNDIDVDVHVELLQLLLGVFPRHIEQASVDFGHIDHY